MNGQPLHGSQNQAALREVSVVLRIGTSARRQLHQLRVAGIVSVVIVERHVGVQLGCFCKEAVAIQLQEGRHADVFTDEAAVEFQTHPFGNLRTDACAGIVAFLVIVCIVHLAVLAQECTRNIVLHLFVTARQAQVMFLSESGLVDKVAGPVLVVIGILVESEAVTVLRQRGVGRRGDFATHVLLDAFHGNVREEMGFTGTCVVNRAVEVLGKGIGVQHVGDIGRTGPTQVVGVRNARLALLTFLGGYQNDTERSTRTVDGSRSGIHQYGDVVDVLRIQLVDVTGHTVNQHEGRCARTCSQVTRTTDIKRRIGVQLTTGIRHTDIQTGNNTLQGLTYGGYRTGFQFLIVHRSHGTGQVYFLLCTETYYHHFVEHLVVFFQLDGIGSLRRIDFHFHIFISDVRNGQDAVRRHVLHVEHTVQVGDDAIGSTFDKYAGTDDGLVLSVCDFTCNTEMLGVREETAPKHQKENKAFFHVFP